MRYLPVAIVVLVLGFVAFWSWQNVPEFKTGILELVNAGRFQTLEARYSAETIMEKHEKELLKDSAHSFLSPDMTFHPYLLMEVKYNQSHDKTCEGVILWSLVDGEMVLNDKNWEMTHGFADCLIVSADRSDFKIINTLASKSGTIDREGLIKNLGADSDVLDQWLDSCLRKNLIVQSGNRYRLHLQNPKISVTPKTSLSQWLVTKPSHNLNRVPKKFRPYQIEKLAKAAFGKDFTIKKTKEIFLPIYNIIVQNPDGSQMTTYWNALTGKRISQAFNID